jgi:hypothetical protein
MTRKDLPEGNVDLVRRAATLLVGMRRHSKPARGPGRGSKKAGPIRPQRHESVRSRRAAGRPKVNWRCAMRRRNRLWCRMKEICRGLNRLWRAGDICGYRATPSPVRTVSRRRICQLTRSPKSVETR